MRKETARDINGIRHCIAGALEPATRRHGAIAVEGTYRRCVCAPSLAQSLQSVMYLKQRCGELRLTRVSACENPALALVTIRGEARPGASLPN